MYQNIAASSSSNHEEYLLGKSIDSKVLLEAESSEKSLKGKFWLTMVIWSQS